jgi:hypothetical protein
LGVTLLCVIHGATVENIFFEDGDDANIFRAFNPTQTFLYFKKKILTYCRAQATMLVIILLCNNYFLKYIFKKNILR